MKIATFSNQPSFKTLDRPNLPPTDEPGDQGPSRKDIFMQGAEIGVMQFGMPAMVGVLVPSHPLLAGALTGAAVVTGRAGGFVRENLGATLSGALVGALTGSVGGRHGLGGALLATGLGALAVGLTAVRESMENGQ